MSVGSAPPAMMKLNWKDRFWHLDHGFTEHSMFSVEKCPIEKLDEYAMVAAHSMKEGFEAGLLAGKIPELIIRWPADASDVKAWVRAWDRIVDQLHDPEKVIPVRHCKNGRDVERPYKPVWRERAAKSAELCEWLNKLLQWPNWLPQEDDDDPRFHGAKRITDESLLKIAQAVEAVVDEFGKESVVAAFTASLSEFSSLQYPHMVEIGEISKLSRIIWVCVIRDGYRKSDFLCPRSTGPVDSSEDFPLTSLEQLRLGILVRDDCRNILESDADRMLRYVEDLRRSAAEAAQASMGVSGTRRRSKKGGRSKPEPHSRKKDQQIWVGWRTGEYKYLAEYADALRLPQKAVKQSLDRHRKRLKSAAE